SLAATAWISVTTTPASPLATSAPTVTMEETANNGTGGDTARSSYTGAVLLSWDEPSGDSEAEFDIYRVTAGTSFTGATPIGSVSATVDNYIDNTASPGVSYQYEVAAVNQ